MQKTVNKHKKLMEKVEFFSFQMELEGNRYVHVLYQRFNKPTGILILDQHGQAVAKVQAKRIVAPMNYYNNIAKGAATDLVREKDRDIRPMRDLHRILLDHASLFSESSIVQDYQQVKDMLEIIIDGQQELRNIFEQLLEIDREARERRRYITMDDVNAFMALNEKYQSILYRQGKMQVESRSQMNGLAEFIKENAVSIGESKRALEVLNGFQAAHVIRALDESLKTFEEDQYGKRHSFNPGQDGVLEMLALYKQKTRHETETNLYALLRNQ